MLGVAMPQMQLPIFPEGVTHINHLIAFEKRDETVTYFNGHMPVFSHAEDDMPTFRMITAQFCVQGTARQVEIQRAFGLPAITVKRAVKRYREQGPKGFYQPRRTRGAAVLTEDVLVKIQDRLDDRQEIPEIALELDLLADTIQKAVRAGRLHRVEKK
jgi:transposase